MSGRRTIWYPRCCPDGREPIRPLLLALILSLAAVPAHALRFIRDAEIEASLNLIAQPLLRAAGLGAGSVRIVIVEDAELNAFVGDPGTIFLHTGLLRRLDTVEMLQAVIAHEIAHIASGHLITRRTAGRSSAATSAIGLALGALAVSAGAGEAATPLVMAGNQVAERRFLSHTRAEEASADQSSVRYMAMAGIDPKAALDTLEIFRGQEMLPSSRIDPYAQTHPLSAERIRLLENAVRSTRVAAGGQDAQLAYWHARMRAKFEGFMQGRHARPATGEGEIALYRQAILAHRQSRKEAGPLLDRLISLRPKDPFYRELKGQFLYERGQIDGAVAAYAQAVALRPRDPLISAGYGKALLALETPSATAKAREVLEAARARDGGNPALLQALALAYGRSGDTGRAALVTAERFALSGRMKDAALQAKRAAGILPRGTPAWRQANDIIAASERLSQ